MNQDRERLKAMVAKLRATAQPAQEEIQSIEVPSIPRIAEDYITHTVDKYGNVIELNDKQQAFVRLALEGKSCILIGAAGTGKTTAQRAVTSALIQAGKAGVISVSDHSILTNGLPGFAILAYTRRAVANIRRAVSEDVKSNCLTIHKFLEYAPSFFEVTDSNGLPKSTMKFIPTRDTANPVSETVSTIIFEESSMIGVDLHKQVLAATPHGPQIIYLGDIQQLPPVFGPAILGFKLLELPVIELTEVYRQALESPIIKLAHRILSGKPIPGSEFKDWKVPGQLTIHPWKKRINEIDALNTLGAFFMQAADNNVYDPEEDIILMPFNKQCGTLELNNQIANHLAHKRGALVHQVIAGFTKLYFSEGEKVLFDKEDATIIKIERNPVYYGAEPIMPSTTLDYWGHDPETQVPMGLDDDAAMDFILNQVAQADKEDGERVKKCSHRITLKMSNTDSEITISTAGEVNNLLLAYALTVHKAQGSEWRKVFFCMHQSHSRMISRELLYTGCTRAREELYIICEPDTFINGLTSQRVKGNTLEEKAEYFKGKQSQMQKEAIED